jgi:hypothetical protein
MLAPIRTAITRAAALSVALTVMACGAGGSVGNAGQPSDTKNSDIIVGDIAPPADSTAIDSASAQDTTDVGPLCPGGVGCPCVEAAGCDTGLCLETPEGKRCADSCVGSCGTGQRCAAIPQGSDVIQ